MRSVTIERDVLLIMRPELLKFNNSIEAEEEIRKINANPIGAKIMALKAVHICVKFKDIETKTANLIKQELLSRGGDVAVSKEAGSFKTKKTDIIIMGTLAQFVRLVKKMKYQSAFECPKLTEELNNFLVQNYGIDIEKVEVW